MGATDQYIEVLTHLKPRDLGILRTHSGQGLNESVDGFDLFSGLWWPLRQRNERAPRREVAWLIAKLYACCQVTQSRQNGLALQLGRCQPTELRARSRYQKKFDRMLLLPIGQIEPALKWALDWVGSNDLGVDWVKLTDDLSIWDREIIRLKWAKQFLKIKERIQLC